MWIRCWSTVSRSSRIGGRLASTGRSFASENLIKQHVLSGSFSTGFALGLLAKDVKIAADLAQQIGIEAPIGRLINQMWSEAREAVGGDQDHSRAWAYWQSRADDR